MNSIFENICIYSYENIKEMKKATMKKGFKIFSLVAGSVLFFIGLVATASTVLSDNAGVIFYCGAVYLFWLYFSYCPKNAKKVYKHNKELYDTEVHTKIQLKDNDIVAHNQQSGVEGRFKYDQVESVIESKNLYLIVLQDTMTLMLDKGGFTEHGTGKVDNFKTFLADKIDESKLHFRKF